MDCLLEIFESKANPNDNFVLRLRSLMFFFGKINTGPALLGPSREAARYAGEEAKRFKLLFLSRKNNPTIRKFY